MWHPLSPEWDPDGPAHRQPDLAIVDRHLLIAALERHGVSTPSLRLRHARVLGGAFTVTLDMIRDGELRGYFDQPATPDPGGENGRIDQLGQAVEQAALIHSPEANPGSHVYAGAMTVVDAAAAPMRGIDPDSLLQAFIHGDMTKGNIILAGTGEVVVLDLAVPVGPRQVRSRP